MCLALVVGNIIGSGVFLLPAALAPYGWNAIFGWIVTILGALALAYAIARLAAALPGADGAYGYTAAAFGKEPAFLVAWSYWISIGAGNGTIAVAAASYASAFAPEVARAPGAGAALAVGVLWTVTLINLHGARTTGFVQIATTLAKLLPLLAVILIAARAVLHDGGASLAPYHARDISLSAVTATAALTLWAMLGFESAGVAAGLVRDPERTVPRATLAGTAFVGLIYIFCCSAVALLLPADAAARSNAPMADFVAAYWGRGPALTVALFAALSALGALNGFVLLQGAVPLSLARAGAFPAWFGKVSARGVPVHAQLLASTLVSLLILSNYSRSMGALFVFMALVATVATLVLYLACAASAIVLALRGSLARPRPVIGIAAAGFAYGMWAFAGAGAEAVLWGIALLATGIPVRLLMRAAASAP